MRVRLAHGNLCFSKIFLALLTTDHQSTISMKSNFYFDNAATTWPKPESVYTFMDSFFRQNGVNPGRGGHAMSSEAEAMTFATRKMIGQFFGFNGDFNRVVFTLNGTDALNIALNSLLDSGDHMITTRIEHNAVLRLGNHLERDKGIELSKISIDKNGYLELEELKRTINANTKVIVLNHASNILGTVQPLKEVAQIAKQYKLKLVVDTAQSAGLIPIDMDALGIDVLTFTGHKGLFGPMGIGGIILAESTELSPLRYGGTGVNSLSRFQPQGYPHQLEAGTLPLSGIAGLHAAQLWFKHLGEAELEKESQNRETKLDKNNHKQLCDVAVRHIHNTEMSLLRDIKSCLQQYATVDVLGNAHEQACVANVSFTASNISAEKIGVILDADHNVCVRTGLHCAPLVHVDSKTVDSGGAVRISPGYFSDEEDMNALRNGLKNVLETI